jgi:hypothetical protein
MWMKERLEALARSQWQENYLSRVFEKETRETRALFIFPNERMEGEVSLQFFIHRPTSRIPVGWNGKLVSESLGAEFSFPATFAETEAELVLEKTRNKRWYVILAYASFSSEAPLYKPNALVE